jgi:CheY-like chemotaxis protein
MEAAAASALQGLRLLLVEDEAVLAFELSDALRSLGCEIVGPVSRLAPAIEMARTAPLDGAILDVNIAEENVFPVADVLAARGIPFVFTTGYGIDGLRETDHGRPVLQKPFRLKALLEIVGTWCV